MRLITAFLLVCLAACGGNDAPVTGKGETPPLYRYASIKAAMEEARSTAGVFWTHHAAQEPGEDLFRVKIVHESDEYIRDYVWVEYLQENGSPRAWRGAVSIEGGGNNRFRSGDTLAFEEADVADWTFREDGKIWGSYTSRAMLDLAPEANTDALRALYHESPVP